MTPADNEDQVEDFLRQAKAEQKSSTLRERTERLLQEGVLRSALGSLRADRFRVQEQLSPVQPTPPDTYVGLPDFQVQKEDVLF